MPRSEYLAYKGIHVLLVLGSAVTAVSGILLLLGSDITPIGPAVASGDVDRSLPIRNAHFIFAMGMLILLLAHVGGVLMYQRRVGRTLSRMRWPRSGAGG
jgi:cytochrome b561